jgi:heme exporter protein C
MTTSASSNRVPPTLWVLTALTIIGMGVTLALGLFVVGPDITQGNVQRLFYTHMPSFFGAFTAFAATLIGGVMYLWKRDPKWDTLALAGVEVGLTFSIITLVTGSSWARPIWNTWWTWDPRLTTTVIMLLIYLVYLLLRRSLEDPYTQARFAAVYALLGFLSVPVTFLSIRMLRTIHPVLFGPGSSNSGSFGITTAMLHTLFINLAAFSLLYAALLWHRVRLQLTEELLSGFAAHASQQTEDLENAAERIKP